MPVHPVHPDPEELAAWKAGGLGGRGSARIEAHVAGCAGCSGVVAAVERGRAALSGLGEPDLPAGLHERLAVAIERERGGAGARARRDRGSTATGWRRSGGGRRVGRRRVALLGVAAALVLLVAGLLPVLRQVTGEITATRTEGRPATAAKAPAPRATGAAGESGTPAAALPVFSAPDGYSGGALQSALQSDPNARAAYQRAANGTSEQRSGGAGGGQAARVAPFGSTGSNGTDADSAGSRVQSGVQQAACVAAARGQAGDQGLRPAFFVSTVYRGRAATVLVAVRAGEADQAELWAFPAGNCSAPPFAHDRVTVQAP